MKPVHLVKVVACLVVAAAWAVPLARPTLAAPGNLTTADRDLLRQVRSLGLFAHPAGLTARDIAADERVREIGERLAVEHADLDRLARAVVVRVGVELPAAADAEQRHVLGELAATRADEFSRVFVERLRAAYQRVLPMIAAVRASTRNDAVRAFATTAGAYVARHLDYLDGIGLVDATVMPVEPTAEGALAPTDREFLVRLGQVILWKQLAGILAQQRAAAAAVKEAGDLIADETRELNKAFLSAAQRLRVPLPDRPSAAQQESLAKLNATSGTDFDRSFVEQLRVADGELLFATAQIRVGTRDDVVRAFSAIAYSTMLRHMAYLEVSGLVRYEDLPAVPRVAGLATTGLEHGEGLHPTAIWLMLAITVVVGTLTGSRPASRHVGRPPVARREIGDAT